MENKLNCITSTGQHQFDEESNRIECKICGLLKSTIESNSTKDVELERVLIKFEKIYRVENKRDREQNIKSFITQVYQKAKEEERERILKELPKEIRSTAGVNKDWPAFVKGFNECLNQVKKII